MTDWIKEIAAISLILNALLAGCFWSLRDRFLRIKAELDRVERAKKLERLIWQRSADRKAGLDYD